MTSEKWELYSSVRDWENATFLDLHLWPPFYDPWEQLPVSNLFGLHKNYCHSWIWIALFKLIKFFIKPRSCDLKMFLESFYRRLRGFALSLFLKIVRSSLDRSYASPQVIVLVLYQNLLIKVKVSKPHSGGMLISSRYQ